MDIVEKLTTAHIPVENRERWLDSTMRQAAKEIEKLRDALKFYADSGAYCMTFGTEDGKSVELPCPVLRDDGRTARNALSANHSHHDGAAPAPSVDGVVGSLNQKGEA